MMIYILLRLLLRAPIRRYFPIFVGKQSRCKFISMCDVANHRSINVVDTVVSYLSLKNQNWNDNLDADDFSELSIMEDELRLAHEEDRMNHVWRGGLGLGVGVTDQNGFQFHFRAMLQWRPYNFTKFPPPLSPLQYVIKFIQSRLICSYLSAFRRHWNNKYRPFIHCIEMELREYRNSCLVSMVCYRFTWQHKALANAPHVPSHHPHNITTIALMLSLISLLFLSGGAEWKFIRRHQKVQKLQGEGERWRAGRRVKCRQSWRVFPGLHECHLKSFAVPS